MGRNLALLLLVCARTFASAEDVFTAPARLVAVGDVHGDYEQLVTVLKSAGLVDEKLLWVGGRAHLVQTGDRVDRGPESRKVMDLLMRLETEAKKAGGMVHPLTGNHEAMNMLGDLRYVSPEEFAALRGPDTMALREALWQKARKERRKKSEPAPSEEDRRRFDAEHPLGFVEHQIAFSPRGIYGSWIARQNAVVRIGDTLFLHGGLSPKYADFSLRGLNERVRQELQEPDPLTALVVQDPEGPLWFRGLAQGDPLLVPSLEAILKKHGCRRMVVGHTPTEGLVMPRYGGRVVVIDVGLSKVYGGPAAALLLEEGRAFALHRGTPLLLPEGEGEPLVRYVREVMALEPDPSRLSALLGRLEAELKAAAPGSR